MTELTPDTGSTVTLAQIGEQLQKHSDRIRLIADELAQGQQTLLKLQANHDAYKTVVQALLKTTFADSLEEIPNGDLEALARDMNAQPLDDYLEQLEKAAGGS